MYLGHFGFAERPFTITPDPRFLYLSERHREALSHLLYGMSEEGGFVQLTGEVGTGKTTLWRYALQRLPAEVDVAVILNSRLTAIELLATLCDELGIQYATGTPSGKVLVDALYRYLLDAHARGRRTVLLIDEAQNLPPEALEQVRMLTNLETPREKLLQIILIGQPELAQLLARKELRQVAQRITARYHLLPFSQQETRAYVLYRTQVAGRQERVFDDAALDEIHRRAGGVPRLINAICDRALLGAYATYRAEVDVNIVRQAADEIASEVGEAARERDRRWVAVAVVGAAVVLTAGVLGLALRDGRLARTLGGGARRAAPAIVAAGPATPASPVRSHDRAVQPPVQTVGVIGARESPPGASPAPPGEPGAHDAGPLPSRALASALADSRRASTRADAFARLFARWGVTLSSERLTAPCDAARTVGLECLALKGTWRVLSRLDLPAVVELIAPDGTKRHAVVTALDRDAATLELGGGRQAFPLAEIELLWDGAFTVLWKRPAGVRTPLRPGTRAAGVVWLRDQLAARDGVALTEPASEVYDEALRRRVIEFQRSHALRPDGIVGDETVLRLVTDSDPSVPALSRSAAPRRGASRGRRAARTDAARPEAKSRGGGA